MTLSLVLVASACTKKAADGLDGKPGKSSTTATKAANEWRGKAPEAGPARPIKLGEYNSFELENGLKVIVVENHKLPVVSYQLSLDNDPVIEGDEVGYVSMAGNLLSTGTKNRTKADIDKAVDFIGASFNSSAGGLFGSSLKKHSGKLLDVMTDVLYNASFPKAEFEKLKKQTLSNLESSKTNATSMAANAAAVINYGADHPYGEVQRIEHVNNITLAKCKDYYDTYFRPNNAYLIIVGDVTPAEAKMNAEKYFGKWERGEIPQQRYATPTGPGSNRVAVVNKDGAVQSVIRVTYPVDLKPGTPDVVKASVMNSILGGGVFSGRLMQNLREDKAYTYGARSSLSSNELVGSFNASASVRNEVTDSSVYEFLYEMERMVNEPVAQADLDLVKSSMAGSFGRSLESPQTIAGFALSTAKYGLPADYFETYLQRLEAVSIADVQQMARKYIKPSNANIVIVGSESDIADKLLRFDADKTIDYYDAFGRKKEVSQDIVDPSVTGKSIVNDYLVAIGGREKLASVKSMVRKMSMEVMGQTADMTEKFLAPDKYAQTTSMAGQVMGEQIFDGTKVSVSQMGQKQVIKEGPVLKAVKQNVRIFKQLAYDDTYKLDFKGMGEVGDVKVYKVEVTSPDGVKSMDYYDIKTSLLLRTSQSMEGPSGQTQNTSEDYSDYREVGGIMMPYGRRITGMMPMALDVKVSDIIFNSAISADDFLIKE